MIRRLLITEVYNNLIESLDFKNIQSYKFNYNGIQKDHTVDMYYAHYDFYVDSIDASVDVRLIFIDNVTAHVILPPKLINNDYIKNNNIISIDYTVGGDDRQFVKSEYKTFIKILKTIITIYKGYMSDNDVYAIAIGASEKNNDSKQKILIYKTLSKYKPDGWVDVERRVMNQDAIIIYDPNKF